jgi:putative glutamine amidotransferase
MQPTPPVEFTVRHPASVAELQSGRPCVGILPDVAVPDPLTAGAGDAEALRSAGALPFLVAPGSEAAAVDALLDWLDGLLLVTSEIREPSRHRRLLRRAALGRTPTLAIAGGLEELNVALGGTLHQRLRAECPQALAHEGAGGRPHVHAVLLEPDSRVAVVYGRGEIRVPSAHGHAVRRPGDDLRATGWATDGLIEAIEARDPEWFCLGVQWRPRWDTADAADRRLLVRFVEACRRSRRPLTSAA